MKKGLKFHLRGMLILLSLVPLLLAVGIISYASIHITRSNLENNAKDTLYIVANNLAAHCYQNKITAINVSDYYDYLDSLKEKNIEMGILIDGAPGATSIKNENDFRIREIESERGLVSNEPGMENGYFDEHVEIDGKVYYGYYYPIEYDGESVGMAFAGELKDEVDGAISTIVNTLITVAAVLVVVFAVITLLFSNGLIKAFASVRKSIDALAKGDLTKQKKRKSAVKEMSNLLEETETMQSNLSETIGKVKEVSTDLINNVSEVTKLSESSSSRAQQITTAMQELADCTVSMAENVQDINAQMMEIGNCVNDISDNVERLHSSSENILNTNNEAMANMSIIMENSQKSVQAVNDIAMQIQQTNESIDGIDEAVALILSISRQTNLLSLNASIEAARAGAQGRGFAVVAEQIRLLSEQSASGAEMIKNLASIITEKSHKSVRQAEEVRSLIMYEQENVSTTQKKFEELSQDIHQSVADIRAIAEKTEYLTDYKEKVIENVQGLSAISEENTASNEEVTANVFEIMSEVQMVNANCERMNLMAGELEESVSFFTN